MKSYISQQFKFYLFVVLMLSTAATAYAVELQSGLRPSDNKLPEAEFEQVLPSPLILPPLAPSEKNKLSSQLIIYIKEIRLIGNKAIPSSELKLITAEYEGRKISSTELQDVREKLTRYYINRGYINSGVIIPDQKMDHGVVILKINEGTLGEINISGLNSLDNSYISDRVQLSAGPPLNINEIQKRLQLIQRDPLIKSINAQLRPGKNRGDANLFINTEEARAYNLSLSLDNYNSPSSGSEQFSLEAFHRNISGRGDTLRGKFSLSEGIDNISLGYTLPLSADGTLFKFRYELNSSLVIEEPFDVINIESKTKTLSVQIEKLVYETLSEKLTIGAIFDKRESRTFLLDIPFSFSASADKGVTRVSALRMPISWTKKLPSQIFAARSQISIGIDAFNSTDQDGTGFADSNFVSWLGQFQWVKRFGKNNNKFVFRASAQIANDELLSLEKFSVGGVNSVRGYRENQLVRDNGFTTSVEMQIPILRDDNGASNVQLIPFVDTGSAWNTGDYSNKKNISSIGVGARWQIKKNIRAELYLAEALNSVPDSTESNLQDSGIHFSIVVSAF